MSSNKYVCFTHANFFSEFQLHVLYKMRLQINDLFYQSSSLITSIMLMIILNFELCNQSIFKSNYQSFLSSTLCCIIFRMRSLINYDIKFNVIYSKTAIATI